MFRELKVKCIECGNEFKIVTTEDFDASQYVCNRCQYGDLEADDE